MKKLSLLLFLLCLTKLVFAGEFDILKFSDPHKYGWNTRKKHLESRENLLKRQKLLQVYELNKQKISSNVIKSIIAPGWGHFSAKRYTKGQVLLGIEIILMGSSLYYYDRAMEDYDKYKNSDYIEDINNYYEDTKMPFIFSQAFFTLGLVIWAYTVYDSAVVTRDYNAELWESIIKEYNKKKLIITPTGFSLRF